MNTPPDDKERNNDGYMRAGEGREEEGRTGGGRGMRGRERETKHLKQLKKTGMNRALTILVHWLLQTRN